jgi:hypothetical protein
VPDVIGSVADVLRGATGAIYESANPLRPFCHHAALISIGIGYYVEIEFSSTASLIVFLALFFANFAVSWVAVILVMDGTLKDAQGRQAQLDIEKSGRAGIALREANAIAARTSAKQS